MKTISDYKREFISLAKEMCKEYGAEKVRGVYVRDINTEYESCTIEI